MEIQLVNSFWGIGPLDIVFGAMCALISREKKHACSLERSEQNQAVSHLPVADKFPPSSVIPLDPISFVSL